MHAPVWAPCCWSQWRSVPVPSIHALFEHVDCCVALCRARHQADERFLHCPCFSSDAVCIDIQKRPMPDSDQRSPVMLGFTPDLIKRRRKSRPRVLPTMYNSLYCIRPILTATSELGILCLAALWWWKNEETVSDTAECAELWIVCCAEIITFFSYSKRFLTCFNMF